VPPSVRPVRQNRLLRNRSSPLKKRLPETISSFRRTRPDAAGSTLGVARACFCPEPRAWIQAVLLYCVECSGGFDWGGVFETNVECADSWDCALPDRLRRRIGFRRRWRKPGRSHHHDAANAMIANGKVYVGTPTGVAVFGLLERSSKLLRKSMDRDRRRGRLPTSPRPPLPSSSTPAE